MNRSGGRRGEGRRGGGYEGEGTGQQVKSGKKWRAEGKDEERPGEMSKGTWKRECMTANKDEAGRGATRHESGGECGDKGLGE